MAPWVLFYQRGIEVLCNAVGPGGGLVGIRFPGKKRYGGVRFNVFCY